MPPSLVCPNHSYPAPERHDTDDTPLCRAVQLFSFSPFYVLFCNVVATSDQRDFDMIRKITDNISELAEANAAVDKVHRLFTKFLDVCVPLVKVTPEPQWPRQNISGLSLSHDNDSGGGMSSQPNSSSPGASDDTRQVWDHSLMWALFDIQPSLAWAESGL